MNFNFNFKILLDITVIVILIIFVYPYLKEFYEKLNISNLRLTTSTNPTYLAILTCFLIFYVYYNKGFGRMFEKKYRNKKDE